ncbi:MAG TPA: flagellar hook-associated protein FlgK [Terracidiphilus sp.]|jgi:flagellar hook-associated protein 1 FlgK
MGTINSAFSVISGALDADQAALSIVANNVANASTPGYTAEVANWQENQPVTINGVSYGDGVTETGATSLRDRVLDERLDQQQQLASSSSARLTALNSVQALFPPDSGSSTATAGDIGSDITSFFASFASLEADPTDDSLRESVLSSASTLAGDISNAASSLNAQGAALNQEVIGVTSQVNSLTTAIARLNQQIQTNSPNSDAGTLEDQRQQDLSQLSQLVGINQVTTQDNGLSVTTTSGQLLVSGNSSFQMTSGTVDGVSHFFVGNTDITAQLATGGGELGGYLTARDQDIPSALSSLDQLAYGISTSVNQLNNAGTDLDGATGTAAAPLDIFSQPTTVAGSAAQMSVVMTDPNQIAAAGLGQGTGDNSNAVAMANLANEPLMPQATTTFSMAQNLDSSTAVGGTVTGSVEIFDSNGQSYDAAVTYTNEGSNTWGYSISVPDTLTADTSVAGQVSYTFGAGETVDPATSLTITGSTAGGGTATITAPAVTAGETVGTAGPPATGYVAALDAQLTAAGITGVTVTGTGGVLTITGATATSGSVIADPVASSNATGTLTFNASGALVTPAANVTGITFSGLSDGADTLNLDWGLYSGSGTSIVTQTAAASSQSAQSQNGSAGANNGETPTDFYSNFVSTLGATVSGVQADNTAQNASVTQLQTQSNALSSVNLNDEASVMSTLQSSYQAASQVFTMLNTIMAAALNLGDQTTVS